MPPTTTNHSSPTPILTGGTGTGIGIGSGTNVRREEILVLYGSQTGNSEQAAKQIANDMPSKLSFLLSSSSSSSLNVEVTARHMQLDDFIEIERARWTRIVVIVTSSYGVGQAPLGCYRFRELCDAIIASSDATSATKDEKDTDSDRAKEQEEERRRCTKFLNGISYAMLGLGDSKFSTFFRNPTVIDEALTAAGARRIGPLGKADASGAIGTDEEQSNVIERWIQGLWPLLAEELSISSDASAKKGDSAAGDDVGLSKEEKKDAAASLEAARRGTVELCETIFEDFRPPPEGSMMSAIFMICVPVAVAVIVAAIKGTLFT